jgi:hypothetical protein
MPIKVTFPVEVVVSRHVIVVVIVALVSPRVEIVMTGIVPDPMTSVTLVTSPASAVATAVAVAAGVSAASVIRLVAMAAVRLADIDVQPANA